MRRTSARAHELRIQDCGEPSQCVACGDTLDLHQLDKSQPETLVAVCLGCRQWWLVFVDDGLVVKLPSRTRSERP